MFFLTRAILLVTELVFLCVSVYYWQLLFGCQYQYHQMPGNTPLQDDLLPYVLNLTLNSTYSLTECVHLSFGMFLFLFCHRQVHRFFCVCLDVTRGD